MEIKHSSQLLRTKQSELKTNDASYLTDKKAADRLEANIAELKVFLLHQTYCSLFC